MRQRYWVAGALSVAIIGLSLALFAYFEQLAAERNAALARKNEKIATDERNSALSTQSLFLADLSSEKAKAGDHVTGILLALEGLPDKAQGAQNSAKANRPYVPEVESSLFEALASANEERVIQAGQGSLITSISLSPDGRTLLSTSSDKTAKIWTLDSQASPLVLRGHEGDVSYGEFSNDGQFVITSSLDKTARIWEVKSGKLILTLFGHNAPVKRSSFSPDQKYVVTEEIYGFTRLWNLQSGKLVGTVPSGKILFSAKGERFLIHAKGVVTIWNPNTLKQIARLPHPTGLNRIAQFDPTGRFVVTSGEDRMLRIWQANNGEHLAALAGFCSAADQQERCGILKIAFSRDGQALAAAAEDTTVWVWHVPSCKKSAELKGHCPGLAWFRCRIIDVTFDPSGNRIATSAEDRTARTWDLETGQGRSVFRGHCTDKEYNVCGITSLRFDPSGEKLVTAAHDKTVRV